MNIIIVPLLILNEFHLHFAVTPGYFDVSIGKCDGLFSGEFGKITSNKNLSLLKEIPTTSKETCRWICSRVIDDCWFIEYSQSNCRLYSLLSFEIGDGNYFEFWKCPEIKCVKFPQRCKGYLVGYDYYQTNDLINFPIKILYNISIIDCQQFCWKNPMCGSINFNEFNSDFKTNSIGTCSLLFGYIPLLKYSQTGSNDSHSVTIRCCKDDIDLKTFSDENIIFDNKDLLVGEWKLCNDKYNLSYFNQIEYSKFYSLAMEICLKTCSKDPFCLMPIYISGFIPSCYLIQNPKIGNFPLITNLSNLITNDSQYFVWEWNTITTKSIPEIFQNDLLFCYCLKKASKILIRNEHCLEFNEIEINSTLSWFVENIQLKINNSFSVNDGFRKFMVVINNVNQMEKCERYNCEIYGNVMNSQNKLIIIDRDEWLPAIPKERDILTLPVDYVIIHNTYKPNGRCFSKSSCSAFIKDFQSFHMNVKRFSDIAYNFLIGEDGNVYEGRGWKFVGSHTKGLNSKSIGVAFIGWFENVEPNTKAFVALRNLIQFGIKNNFIVSQYELKTYRDLRGGENPGIKLHNIIQSWGFMNLSTIPICSQKSPSNYWYVIIGLGGIVLFFMIISVISYQFGVHNSKNCKTVKNQLKCSDLKIGWYFEDNYEMKFEKINVRKDWIYYCEEIEKQDKNVCQCFINFYGLWVYCLMMPNANFMYKLMLLNKSLNCSKPTHLYALKSNITNQESKTFIFFHTNIISLEKRDYYFQKLKSSKLCICRKFSVKKLPKSNHEQLLEHLPTNLEIISSENNKSFENSTKMKSILL